MVQATTPLSENRRRVVREIEAKIGLQAGEIDVIRERLRAAGAEFHGIDDEKNVLLDKPDHRIRTSGQTLRIRSFASRPDAVLTFKGPAEQNGAFKARDEWEVQVSDGHVAQHIFESLGFRATTTYHKRREQWRLDGAIVTLDSLKSGDYVEIEADEQAIARVRGALGLEGRPHITAGYAKLERRHAARLAAQHRTSAR
jgi:adenylate cyclase class 2